MHLSATSDYALDQVAYINGNLQLTSLYKHLLSSTRAGYLFVSSLYYDFVDEIGLHRMENPSHTDYAVSLHLYCPPFDKCRSFDERTGKANQCQVTFWSVYGKRTPIQSVSAKYRKHQYSMQVSSINFMMGILLSAATKFRQLHNGVNSSINQLNKVAL